MYVQMDPAGQVSLHPPHSQLYHSSHLLHQRLVLPPSDLVLLLSHKEEEEGFTQGEEGRQVFHRQLRLERETEIKREEEESEMCTLFLRFQRNLCIIKANREQLQGRGLDKVCRWLIQNQHKAQFLLNIWDLHLSDFCCLLQLLQLLASVSTKHVRGSYYFTEGS